MKTIQSLDLQIVCNCGNYESLRLGVQWTPESSDIDAEMKQADAALRAAAARVLEARKQPASENIQGSSLPQQNKQPMSEASQPQKQGCQKEKLTESHPKLQAIVRRIENKTATIETILKFYEPTEAVMNLLNLAAGINPNKQQ